MGNNNSSSAGGEGRAGGSGPFQRRTGSLGLSRAELDKRCKPSGLYESCSWDDRTIRRLIADGKLSARQVGTEERTCPTHQECPICFLHYNQINSLTCCHANICTECYLQVASDVKGDTKSCPFCNNEKMSVVVATGLNVEEVRRREEEEQRVIEAAIRARNKCKDCSSTGPSGGVPDGVDNNNDDDDDDDENSDHPSLLSSTTSDLNTDVNEGTESEMDNSFGSSLTRNLQSRAFFTPNSPYNDNSNNNQQPSMNDSSSSYLTPEQRSHIEQEMRSQTSHPLYQQIQQQEEHARTLHEIQHVEQTRNRLLHSRLERAMLGITGGGSGDGSGGGGGGLSMLSADARSDRMRRRMRLLDDDVYSEEEEDDDEVPLDGFPRRRPTRRRGQLPQHRGNMNEMFWVEAALLMSMQEDAEAQRLRANQEENAEDENGEGEGEANEMDGPNVHGNSEGGGNPLDTTRTSRNNRIQRRARSRRNGRASPTSTETAANVLLSSMTEEDQVAIAIALSLRESENQASQQEQDQEGDRNNGNNDDDDDANDEENNVRVDVGDSVAEEHDTVEEVTGEGEEGATSNNEDAQGTEEYTNEEETITFTPLSETEDQPQNVEQVNTTAQDSNQELDP